MESRRGRNLSGHALGSGPVIGAAVAAGALALYFVVRAIRSGADGPVASDEVDFVAADVALMARMRDDIHRRLDAVTAEEATLRAAAADHAKTDAEQMRWRGLSEECTRILLELDGATVHHPDARVSRKQLIADVLKVADALKLE
uniref:BAG domain-containing protein n=1 Tax=Neobodo designis TaxID=312471 RepID=A0A7S1MII0_NEODS|mmetsp:Transcript_41291/g.127572  ORF Transcript_41291/g.127572 Transcript_41291/m.127572 type:complete len:145 (+) Transcript_41291:35-469(+)